MREGELHNHYSKVRRETGYMARNYGINAPISALSLFIPFLLAFNPSISLVWLYNYLFTLIVKKWKRQTNTSLLKM